MPRIIVTSLSREIEVTDNSRTVFQHLQENQVDWMHACGTKGRCTTCRMIVLEGMTSLSALSDSEIKYRSEQRLQPNERLACQCMLSDDISIRVPVPCQLPHLHYTD